MKKRHPIKDQLVEAEENRRDLGFGTQVNEHDTRLLNRDGSFNVKRSGGTFWSRLNIFNRLMVCSWGRFFLLVISFYLILNFIFAGIYEFVGIENLQGADLTSRGSRFMDAFFSLHKHSQPLVMDELPQLVFGQVQWRQLNHY